jgi:hypothetical protein
LSLAYPDEPLTDGVVRLRAWTPADLACVEAASRVLERAGFGREALLHSYLAFPTRRVDALVYALVRG